MFQDEEVIARIRRDFIPFAGNTNELQVSKIDSPEKQWFLKSAIQLHPGAAKGVTAQGFYVFGPDGQAHAFSMHSRQKAEFLKLLDSGLANYRSRPIGKVDLPAQLPKQWSLAKPSGTFVVRSISRVTPFPEGAPEKNRSIGRDHLWILPEDTKALLAKLETSFAMPDAMARRLARFHLVDNVRGEPTRWRYNDIKVLELTMTRQNQEEIHFGGLFKMANKEGHSGSEKGIAGEIEGIIRLNARGKLISYEAFASGLAWGDHANTNGAPTGKYPIKIAFRSVDDDIARSVPPQQSYFWAEYLNPRSAERVPWP